MGLGGLFTSAPGPADVQDRVITELAIIDGQPVQGPGAAIGQYRGITTIPGAWRASLLLSDVLATVPWHAYRSRGGAPVERMDPVPPLLEQPAPPDTRVTTFSSLVLDLVNAGNGIGIIAARNAEGWPTAIVPVPAETAQVARTPAGPVYSIGGELFTAAEVLHVKGPCRPGALRGMAAIEQHLDTFNLTREQRRQAGGLTQHAVPTGVLKVSAPNLTQPEADEVKAKWMKAQRDRTVAVLNATTEFESLAWDPTKTQLLDARKFSLHEIALIYGIDPSWLGAAQASRTYSNIEQEAINLVRFSLGGHLGRFEAALSLLFPRGTTVKASLDSLLRADTITRYRAHEIGLRAGFVTDDEVRDLEDRAPLTAAQRAQIAAKRAPAPPPRPADDQDETEGGDDAGDR